MPIAELPLLSEEDAAPSSRILILGAGYAGLRVAQTLGKMLDEREAPELVLVDRYSYHQIITELPVAASGRIGQEDVALPLDQLLQRARVRFIQAEIGRIDLEARQVITTRGRISYGTLVVALGSVTAYYGVPGLVEHALTLKSVEDAQKVKEAIERAIEEAARSEDPVARAGWLNVLIGGAGLTGVELAGELAEILPNMAKAHGLDPRTARVTLIEGAPVVLPTMPERLQSRGAAILADLGIRLVLGSLVVSADAEGVHLASGERLVGRTLVWTGGIMAPGLLAESGLPTVRNGQVPVDEYLQVEDYPDIYVIGDSAQIEDPTGEGFLAPTAQVALAQAEITAYNIVAGVRGWARRRYAPHDKGQVVSLGTTQGVASVLDIPLSGRKVLALKGLIAEGYRFAVTGRVRFRRGVRGAHLEP